MNEETATVDFLCPTVDRATGTLRRLVHRVVLLCAASSYLLSLPLQVTFLGFLSLGGKRRRKGGPPLPRRSVTFGPKPGYGSRESPEIGAPPLPFGEL